MAQPRTIADSVVQANVSEVASLPERSAARAAAARVWGVTAVIDLRDKLKIAA